MRELRESKSKLELTIKKVQSEKKEAPDQNKALEALRAELREATRLVRTWNTGRPMPSCATSTERGVRLHLRSATRRASST